MNAVKSLWLGFALVAYNVAEHCEICYLNDVKCMTKGAVKVYSSVTGHDSWGRSYDPLNLKSIESENGSTTYNFTNIIIKGLKNCKVTELDVNVNDTIYKHFVQCPKLITTFDLETKDASNTTTCLEDHQRLQVTGSDYKIQNLGQYSIYVDQTDHKPHVFVKSNNPKVDISKVICTCGHHSNTDQSKSNEPDCPTNVDTTKFINSIIIKEAMRMVMLDGIQAYCRKNDMSYLFPNIGTSKKGIHL